MTIIVEDGSIVTNANSYVSIADVTTYAENYGYLTTWSGTTVTDTIREQSLLRAMRYIEGLSWRGKRQTQDQGLEFPRSELYDDSNYLLADNTVPTKVANAVCEAVILSLPDSTIDLQAPTTKDDYKTGVRVQGAVQETWFTGGKPIRSKSTIIEDMLKGYLKNKIIVEIKRG
jgi:hypothetical protein